MEYNNSAIDLYTVNAHSLEHKKCYKIVIGKEKKCVYVLKVRRDFLLRVCIKLLFHTW